MRTLLVVAVLGSCCLLAGANTSLAADHSQVPASMLSQMGLGGMQPMSDAQGMAVRGKGWSSGGTTIQVNSVVFINSINSSSTQNNCTRSVECTTNGTASAQQNNNISSFAFIQVNVSNVKLGGGVMVP